MLQRIPWWEKIIVRRVVINVSVKKELKIFSRSCRPVVVEQRIFKRELPTRGSGEDDVMIISSEYSYLMK
jgi:hypothetical protein